MDAAGGSMRACAAPIDEYFGTGVRCSAMAMGGAGIPLSNGKLLVPGYTKLYQFDMATTASSIYMDGHVAMATVQPSARWSPPMARSHALEPGGPRALVNPGDYLSLVLMENPFQLVVTDDVFAVISNSAFGLSMVRIPRS